jgi:starch synthase
LGYQGIFESHDMHLTDLGWDYFTSEWIEYYGKINFLKGGLVAADAIHTVSRRYAQEIQAEEFGCGLEGVLKKRSRDVFGVLNGVDYSEWNPMRDRFIKANYGPNELYGKRSCKFDLQQEFGFARNLGIPLIGILSDLVEHKGFDILSGVLPEIMKLDIQIALAGSGEKRFEDFFREAQSKFPGRVGARIGKHDLILHKIQAGADMLLIPSKFEPYGDLQRYALKYGTVPVVFAAGGLDDAIHGLSSRRNGANGFKFARYTGADLLKTLQVAVDVFRREPETWSVLMKNGMSEDFSWKALAGQYIQMYEIALDRALKKKATPI